jgi:hypothetical protein
MRRSAAVPKVSEPIPWRLYLLTFVSWVLIALLGGPDAVAGSGSGPLPHEPFAAVHEAAERTLRSTFRLTLVDDDDPPNAPRLVVAVDPGADVLMMWEDDKLGAFRVRGDAYLLQEGSDKPWKRYAWPGETRPEGLAIMGVAGSDIELWQMPLWLIDGLVQAERTGSRTYSGTIDMRRAGPRHPGLVRDMWDNGSLGPADKATPVPFEAAVDSRGRLVRLTLLRGDTKASPDTYQLSGLGDPVRPPSLPSADIEDLG